jgi:L1 cell adhesion molecule like protein
VKIFSKRMTKALPIGIDLGTTYSCVAVWKNERAEIIPNDQGNRVTPSCVAFNDSEHLVGDAAFNQMDINAANTIYGVKRLIGRRFTDPEVAEDIQLWPFSVINSNDRPMVQVQYKGQKQRYTPEQISSMILGRMKLYGEKYLGEMVQDAVITVPAYFNDSQRQATRDAGKIAGLNVLRIVNEPTAAAISYGLERVQQRTILVYDLGGGTFDVSLLKVNHGEFAVKAVGGDTHLGGEDFDNRLVKFLVEEFKRKHNKDLTKNAKAIRRLRTQCERAKRQLTAAVNTTIELDALMDGIDFHFYLSRARFEELIDDLVKSTLKTVQQVLKDAKMDTTDIDDILLVGGSTRIPKVQKVIQDFFDKQPCQTVNPDEAVAGGAAILAASLRKDVVERNKFHNNKLAELTLKEVTPLTLGIDVYGDLMSAIIPRNSPIPTLAMRAFQTSKDNQTIVTIKVLEGERTMTKDNHLLGTFDLKNIPPRKRGQVQLDVSFAQNEEGILTVHAKANTGHQGQIEILPTKSALSREEVTLLVAEAEQRREEDAKKLSRIQARINVEIYAGNVKDAAEGQRIGVDGWTAQDRQRTVTAADDLLEWLDEHDDEPQNAYEQQHEQLKQLVASIGKLTI